MQGLIHKIPWLFQVFSNTQVCHSTSTISSSADQKCNTWGQALILGKKLSVVDLISHSGFLEVKSCRAWLQKPPTFLWLLAQNENSVFWRPGKLSCQIPWLSMSNSMAFQGLNSCTAPVKMITTLVLLQLVLSIYAYAQTSQATFRFYFLVKFICRNSTMTFCEWHNKNFFL